MSKLWLRQARLTFGPKGGVGVGVENLRISFTIGKTSDSNCNTSQIKIYNLREASRGVLEHPGNFATLEAGYQDTGLSVIFKGDIDRSEFKRVGPDWVTTIYVGDGRQALEQAHLDKSYAANVDVQKIAKDVAQSFKDTAAVIIGSKTYYTVPSKNLQNGFSATGMAKDIMDRLMRSLGFEWSIQDNELLFLAPYATDGEEATVLTPKTGLIGSPVRREEGVEFTSLIIPKIRPGRLVTIQSKAVNGNFRVRKVQFKGDTHGKPWFAKVVAVPTT